MLQVYSRAPGSSIEAGPRICLRNSREIILQLIILLHVYYTRHFLRWHLSYFPLWDSRAPHEWCHVTYPLSDHGLGRVVLCPYRQSFHRVQSPRNLAHSLLATSRPAVSISLLTVCSTTGSPKVSLGSGIVTRFVSYWRSCLRCLTHFSRRQELPSGTAHEEYPLQVSLSPRLLSTPFCSDRSLYSCLKRSIS